MVVCRVDQITLFHQRQHNSEELLLQRHDLISRQFDRLQFLLIVLTTNRCINVGAGQRQRWVGLGSGAKKVLGESWPVSHHEVCKITGEFLTMYKFQNKQFLLLSPLYKDKTIISQKWVEAVLRNYKQTIKYNNILFLSISFWKVL